VDTSLTTPPSQVEIESKFLEITQNNLKELGLTGFLASLRCRLEQEFTGAVARLRAGLLLTRPEARIPL